LRTATLAKPVVLLSRFRSWVRRAGGRPAFSQGRPRVLLLACVLLAVTVLVFAGCASLTITDTKPLSPDQLNPPGSVNISRGGYRVNVVSERTDAPGLLVLVAFSGGGKRSAAFGYGAIKGMRDVTVPTPSGPRPLLNEITVMSGVSGGSFPAAYYALYRDSAFGKFEQDFLYRNTTSNIYGIYLLPWNWTWLVDPNVGTNDFMARVYDRTMFHGATFADLQQRGPPVVAIGATDISYGTAFLFTQEFFDLICSDLSAFPVARAVAASNGFPGLFSPITLTSHTRDCGGRKPQWVTAVTPEQIKNPLSRVGQTARIVDHYLDPNKTTYVHLVDGGVADNLALRAIASMQQAVTRETLTQRGFNKIRRVLIMSIDGEGTENTALAHQKVVLGLLRMILQASGAQIDRYGFETLIAVTEQLNEFSNAIAAARCAEGPVIDGTPCGDVKAQLLHMSLANSSEGPNKDKLLAIPTGLTIPREDVDLLIQVGHDAITSSTELRNFLDGYPPAPLPPATRPARGGRVAVRN
jgi:NTE family protein